MFVTWLPLSCIYTQYLVNSVESATFFKDVNLKLITNVGKSLERTRRNRKCEKGELQKGVRCCITDIRTATSSSQETAWQQRNPWITLFFWTFLSPHSLFCRLFMNEAWKNPVYGHSISVLKKTCKHFLSLCDSVCQARETWSPRRADSSKKAGKRIYYNFLSSPLWLRLSRWEFNAAQRLSGEFLWLHYKLNKAAKTFCVLSDNQIICMYEDLTQTPV